MYSLEERFNAAYEDWKEYYHETGSFHSNPHFMYDNQGHRDLIALGLPVLPLLKPLLREYCTYWRAARKNNAEEFERQSREPCPVPNLYMAAYTILCNANIDFTVPPKVRYNICELHGYAADLIESLEHKRPELFTPQ